MEEKKVEEENKGSHQESDTESNNKPVVLLGLQQIEEAILMIKAE